MTNMNAAHAAKKITTLRCRNSSMIVHQASVAIVAHVFFMESVVPAIGIIRLPP
jgi:hypothetical protein